jgi:hypothetical protein
MTRLEIEKSQLLNAVTPAVQTSCRFCHCEVSSIGVRDVRQKAVLVPVVLDGERPELVFLAQLPLQALGFQVSTMRVNRLSEYSGESIPLSAPAAR